MVTLTTAQFEKAVHFMKEQARPLERAMFEHVFEGGGIEAVIEELSKFQNSDGGFGHGLEPDVRMKESSVLATTIALDYMSHHKITEPSLVNPAFEYLINQFIHDEGSWEIVPQVVNQYPRAPWWNYQGVRPQVWGNPNAEVLGYFIEFQGQSERFTSFDQVYDKAFTYLISECSLDDMHEMYCYVRLYERLTRDECERIRMKMDEFVFNTVQASSQASGYFASPLQIVKSPDSSFYSKYADIIESELENLINKQASDGGWYPAWQWGQYEDEWNEAKLKSVAD